MLGPSTYQVPCEVLDGFIDNAIRRENELMNKVQQWEELWRQIRTDVEDSGEVTMSSAVPWKAYVDRADDLIGYSEERNEPVIP